MRRYETACDVRTESAGEVVEVGVMEVDHIQLGSCDGQDLNRGEDTDFGRVREIKLDGFQAQCLQRRKKRRSRAGVLRRAARHSRKV